MTEEAKARMAGPFAKRTARLVTAALLGCLLLAGTALAAAPRVKSQAPGYYRIRVGSFVVTALFDGNIALPADQLLLNISKARVDKILAEHFLPSPVPTSVNGFLIDTGRRLVLVDTGAGRFLGPSLDKLVRNLAAAGYSPAQVEAICITHMHPDHVGGLVADGQRVFPNATVYANQRDADYWLSAARMKAAPPEKKRYFQEAVAALTPYSRAGKFKTFRGDTELMPGIEAVPAPGHTPGHTMYRVHSEGHSLLLWGDIVHVASVQFANPSIAIKFDTDPREAVATRQKVFREAAESGELIGGAHLAFPGLGHLRKARRGYAFVPINYLGEPGN